MTLKVDFFLFLVFIVQVIKLTYIVFEQVV